MNDERLLAGLVCLEGQSSWIYSFANGQRLPTTVDLQHQLWASSSYLAHMTPLKRQDIRHAHPPKVLFASSVIGRSGSGKKRGLSLRHRLPKHGQPPLSE
ncbi:hypothetical protein H0G86_002248 [Trichoderma simmonsii]|uniref:Uncharacterized protein n=1 Tax=Trichoderma simmonsii TaxID=1491479 RepID=A0A8G0L864_9HYPO|nr:hypothetical protein H0G86_002248 [Trichoderma simmonsii]